MLILMHILRFWIQQGKKFLRALRAITPHFDNCVYALDTALKLTTMSSLTKSPDARVEMADSSVKRARFGRQKDSRRTAAGNSSWKTLVKVNVATIFFRIFVNSSLIIPCTGYLYSSPQWSFLAVCL